MVHGVTQPVCKQNGFQPHSVLVKSPQAESNPGFHMPSTDPMCVMPGSSGQAYRRSDHKPINQADFFRASLLHMKYGASRCLSSKRDSTDSGCVPNTGRTQALYCCSGYTTAEQGHFSPQRCWRRSQTAAVCWASTCATQTCSITLQQSAHTAEV